MEIAALRNAQKKTVINWYPCSHCLNNFQKRELFIVSIKAKNQRSPMWVQICRNCYGQIKEDGLIRETEETK